MLFAVPKRFAPNTMLHIRSEFSFSLPQPTLSLLPWLNLVGKTVSGKKIIWFVPLLPHCHRNSGPFASQRNIAAFHQSETVKWLDNNKWHDSKMDRWSDRHEPYSWELDNEIPKMLDIRSFYETLRTAQPNRLCCSWNAVRKKERGTRTDRTVAKDGDSTEAFYLMGMNHRANAVVSYVVWYHQTPCRTHSHIHSSVCVCAS